MPKLQPPLVVQMSCGCCTLSVSLLLLALGCPGSTTAPSPPPQGPHGPHLSLVLLLTLLALDTGRVGVGWPGLCGLSVAASWASQSF